MTVIALPGIPGVQAVDWTLERNVALFESPLTRVAQRISRTGHRWRANLTFPMYQNNDAGVLAAWLDQISRGDRWLYLSPPQSSARGAWAPPEVLTNGTLVNDVTTGWTATSSTLSVNARRLKIVNTGAANGRAIQQNLTVETGKPYVMLGDAFFGNVSNARMLVTRMSDSAIEASLILTAPARGVLLVTPTEASVRADYRTDTTVAGDYTFWGGMSLARCLQVAGGSQTGVRLNVDGGPASLNAAIRAGEFVGLLTGSLYQLLRLVEDFDTNSSGAGTLVFEPTLRAAPADDAVVIVRQPFARFRIAESTSTQRVTAPNFNGFTLEALEDVTP